MPPKVWGAGSGPQTTVYSAGTNWTGDTKPGVGDDVVLNSVDVTDCILDEATAALNSLTIDFDGGDVGDYTGTLNFNGFAATITGGGDAIFGGSGTVDCSASTITCSGNFDNKDQGTWDDGTSTVVMNGVGKTILSKGANNLFNLTISENTELLAASSGNQVLAGTLTVASGKVLTLNKTISCKDGVLDGSVTVGLGRSLQFTGDALSMPGGVTGPGTLLVAFDVVISDASGVITPAFFNTAQNVTLAPGTYGNASTVCLFRNDNPGSNRELTFAAGAYVFPGDVTFDSDKVTRTFTVNMAAVTDVAFGGNVNLSESGGGTLSLTKPTAGTITIAGTVTYTDDSDITQDIGDVEVSGDLTLASDMDCGRFDGLAGGSLNMGSATHMLDASDGMDWEINFEIHAGSGILTGAVIRTNGDFTADNQDIVEDGGTWELQVMGGGSAVASGAGSVKNCDARGDGGSGGTEIQALAWTDDGGNQNWNFAAVGIEAFKYYYDQQEAVA